MILDLTQIPVEDVKLSWLSRITAQVKPSKIMITNDQHTHIFSQPTNSLSKAEKWDLYRGVPLVTMGIDLGVEN